MKFEYLGKQELGYHLSQIPPELSIYWPFCLLISGTSHEAIYYNHVFNYLFDIYQGILGLQRMSEEACKQMV